MNILIVDDEQLVRWFLERALIRWGHKVISVSSAREAMSALEQDEFDLVFTDLRMPEENGAILVNKLSEIPNKRKPEVVVCSAYVTSEMSDNFRKQGIRVLRKPFKLEELELVISELA